MLHIQVTTTSYMLLLIFFFIDAITPQWQMTYQVRYLPCHPLVLLTAGHHHITTATSQ
jgi:hypothetical protein